MGTQCRLVVLETSANQSYIFDTTSRRESVGASHLVGSLHRWTTAALARSFDGWTADDRLADGAPAELVAAAGGAVTLLVSDLAAARELVTEVTLTALVEAPGLDVCGVVETFVRDSADDGGALAAAVARARHALPAARSDRPRGPQARFLRLPLVAACTATGLPASALYDEAGGDRDTDHVNQVDRVDRTAPAGDVHTGRPNAGAGAGADTGADANAGAGSRSESESARLRPRSRTALVKLGVAGPQGDAYDRLAGSLCPELDRVDARDGLEAAADFLERDAGWVAVVHADGNGLGELFQRLPEFVVGAGSDAFAEGLRQLSDAVERATQDALRTATAELAAVVPTTVRRPGSSADGMPALLPLALGGDDLTVVCDGESALAFAAGYLYAFEAATRRHFAAIPPSVLSGLPDRVSAAAGVAIVKPGHPFVNAYRLAVDLTREAKAVKTFERGSSALSFHVLHDSATTTLTQVRDRTTFVEPTADHQLVRLVAQPYVVDGPGSGRALGGVAGSTAWGARHRWVDLLARVDALRGVGSRAAAAGSTAGSLSRAQAHDLRTGMFAGRMVADARFDLVRYRYDADTLDRLAPGGSLFWTDGAADGALVTGLLDAMDAEAFLPRPSALRAVGAGHR